MQCALTVAESPSARATPPISGPYSDGTGSPPCRRCSRMGTRFYHRLRDLFQEPGLVRSVLGTELHVIDPTPRQLHGRDGLIEYLLPRLLQLVFK